MNAEPPGEGARPYSSRGCNQCSAAQHVHRAAGTAAQASRQPPSANGVSAETHAPALNSISAAAAGSLQLAEGLAPSAPNGPSADAAAGSAMPSQSGGTGQAPAAAGESPATDAQPGSSPTAAPSPAEAPLQNGSVSPCRPADASTEPRGRGRHAVSLDCMSGC